MRTFSISGTDLQPTVICMGSTHIGSGIDRETSFRLFDLYFEQGGNFIDTASVYANWLPIERHISEKTIGQWMKQRKSRAKMILATKGAHPDLATMHIPRLSRQEIVQDLEASLQNLQTDTIDLYWLHRDDPNYPVEDILETLEDQVDAGKVRYYGCSNWWVGRIRAAQEAAAARGWQGFCANQMMWSLAVIDPEGIHDKTMAWLDDEMKAYHQETGFAAIPYSSQANGLFQRMAQGTLEGMDPNARGMYRVEENQQLFERIERLAASSGLSITQIVLGYLQGQPFPTAPIVGCRTVEQLWDTLQASETVLKPDQVKYLEGGE